MLRIGQVLRYSKPGDVGKPEVNGLPNFFYFTYSPGQTARVQAEAGISTPAAVPAPDGLRRPVVLVRSSPHKVGSKETPWQDFFDVDRGHIRYFGDNKAHIPAVDPATARGNQVMLEQFRLHTSTEYADRLRACPIACFRSVRVGKRAKGYIEFQGFGLIERAERITQYDRKLRSPFTNYVFDIAVLSLTAEREEFDWSWISTRRDASCDLTACLDVAPQAWKKWVAKGQGAMESGRRRVVTLLTTSVGEQKPTAGSREAGALKDIVAFYAQQRLKARFEALAAAVAASVLRNAGGAYRHGWLTSASSDGGADFIGRLDVGTGLARAKMIVLGQAKCEDPNKPTGGNHIARTVARLRRGWIGVYVTTSFFSEPVQREVLTDKYPLVMINGLRLAQEVLLAVHKEGCHDVREYLDMIDSGYDEQVMYRDPEEILYD
jgi:hypothetical protein